MSEYKRVLDKDTGHKSSVPLSELPHGNYEVLDEPAVNPLTLDPLPVELAAPDYLPDGPRPDSEDDPDGDDGSAWFVVDPVE